MNKITSFSNLRKRFCWKDGQLRPNIHDHKCYRTGHMPECYFHITMEGFRFARENYRSFEKRGEWDEIERRETRLTQRRLRDARRRARG